MKKFFSLILMILICATTIFSGCSLVQMNSSRYLDRVVAKIETQEYGELTVTKQELLTVYQNYASTYVNSYGYTIETAVDEFLNNLVERELMVAYLKKDMGNLEDYSLTAYNEVMNEVYDYIQNSVLTVENNIRLEMGLEKIVLEDETENTEENTTYSPETKYESKVSKIATGNYERIIEDVVEDTVKIGSFDKTRTVHTNQEVSQLAWNRYIKALYKNENDSSKSSLENDVLNREIQRLYEVYAGNKYIELFEENYNKNNKTISNDLILNKYKELVLASYAKYNELGNEGYTTYVADMKSDSSKVYYHPYATDITKRYAQVAHILVKFSDAQLEELKQLDTQLANGEINQEEYDLAYNAWKDASNCVGTLRDETGKETETTKNVTEIRNTVLASVNAQLDLEAKASVFNDYLYEYSQDTGSINSGKYYAVNLNKELENSDWQQAFYDEVIRLSDNEGAGYVSEPIYVHSDSYTGYHIIFIAGYYDNLATIENIANVTVDKLWETRVMAGVEEKSMYDVIFDLLEETSYKTTEFNAYKASVVDGLKRDSVIRYYKTYYKDLY